MKKIFLIFFFFITSVFGYFDSDFLTYNRAVAPPYFYGSFNYGGGPDMLQDYLNYLRMAVSGTLDITAFHKSLSSMYGYMKFKHSVFGAEMFVYDSIIKLKNSTAQTDKKEETTILSFHMYENNKVYDKIKAGFLAAPYFRQVYYRADDHNILTSDYSRTNTYFGCEVSAGLSYKPVSFFEILTSAGPDIFYHRQSKSFSAEAAGTVSFKYYTQIYTFSPIWIVWQGYYRKNYFEDNFGSDLYMKPNKYMNFLAGLSETKLYMNMNVSPFSFVYFRFSCDYNFKQEQIGILMGMTLYYDGLGMPAFR